MDLSEQGILKAFANKGYKFFKETLSVNVFGIRMKTNTNKFDDYICVAYYDDEGCFMCHMFLGTTEPGMHWLKNPMRKSGCAIYKEGQYIGAYIIGPHGKSGYSACRQVRDIEVYRDDNKDSIHDMDNLTVEKGVFYCNIHHGYGASKVGRNSAGCQVIQSKYKFVNEFMPLVVRSCKLYGNRFSYTLFNCIDFE